MEIKKSHLTDLFTELRGLKNLLVSYNVFSHFSLVFCYIPDTSRKYKVGETFTLGNCSKTCRCNENGEISCTPMCPKIKCGRGKRPKGKGIIALVETRGCSCEIQECVPGK